MQRIKYVYEIHGNEDKPLFSMNEDKPFENDR